MVVSVLLACAGIRLGCTVVSLWLLLGVVLVAVVGSRCFLLEHKGKTGATFSTEAERSQSCI